MRQDSDIKISATSPLCTPVLVRCSSRKASRENESPFANPASSENLGNKMYQHFFSDNREPTGALKGTTLEVLYATASDFSSFVSMGMPRAVPQINLLSLRGWDCNWELCNLTRIRIVD